MEPVERRPCKRSSSRSLTNCRPDAKPTMVATASETTLTATTVVEIRLATEIDLSHPNLPRRPGPLPTTSNDNCDYQHLLAGTAWANIQYEQVEAAKGHLPVSGVVVSMSSEIHRPMDATLCRLSHTLRHVTPNCLSKNQFPWSTPIVTW